MKWEDPPAPQGRLISDDEIQKLRANPGKWALLAQRAKKYTVHNLKGSFPDIEFVQRRVGKQYKLFAQARTRITVSGGIPITATEIEERRKAKRAGPIDIVAPDAFEAIAKRAMEIAKEGCAKHKRFPCDECFPPGVELPAVTLGPNKPISWDEGRPTVQVVGPDGNPALARRSDLERGVELPPTVVRVKAKTCTEHGKKLCKKCFGPLKAPSPPSRGKRARGTASEFTEAVLDVLHDADPEEIALRVDNIVDMLSAAGWQGTAATSLKQRVHNSLATQARKGTVVQIATAGEGANRWKLARRAKGSRAGLDEKA